MEQFEKNSRTIRKICLFFIMVGLIEIFLFVFLSKNFLSVIPGLITIIPAFFTLNKDLMKRRYFVGIWSLIKYNPVSIALVAFVLGDLFGGAINYNYSVVLILMIIFFLIGASSIVLGIIIIFKISKHNKYIINFQNEKKNFRTNYKNDMINDLL
ncbi:MAG: hypothetical protein HY951_15665 [Bacteroidia bacterium]|nr:hypothetical protein [Bacteroidia bacterium]